MAKDRQLLTIAWIASIFLHVGLFLWAVPTLVHPARCNVVSSPAFVKINLVIEPPSVRVPSPSTRPLIRKNVLGITNLGSARFHRSIAKSSASPQRPSNLGATQTAAVPSHNMPPPYPEEARARGEQGVVILRVQVTAAGIASAVDILKSSGCFQLDEAARQAVRQWSFFPASSAGLPMSSQVDVPIRFCLYHPFP
jgi:protein TonB